MKTKIQLLLLLSFCSMKGCATISDADKAALIGVGTQIALDQLHVKASK